MFIGIDIGSKSLDLAASEPSPALPRRVPNTPDGIARLVAALTPAAPTLIVMEATGVYHQPLLAALLLAALPVSVVNPAQIVAFRQSRLGRHKTDRADAKLLARFAALHHTELRRATPDEPDLARLRQYIGVRDDLVAEQTAWRNRQQTAWRNRQQAAQWAGASEVVAVVKQHLAQIATLRHEVEQQIAAILASRPETAALTSQTGVGILTAAAVLAYLPGGVLGRPKAAAAYAGLHPRQEQSGQRDRSRLSKQGCPELRRYLYLAAMCAIQHDREIQAWYRSLCDRGKAPQRATCAVAHKLLRRMMGRVRDARADHHVLLPLAA